MPAASFLRRWLRRTPHPVRLRVDGRDVAIATGPRAWADTEDSILAIGGTKIEAFGDNNVLLRATSLGDDEPEDAPSSTGATELENLARLICEAHDAGARRHAESYALAFQENTKLVQILAQRLGGLEQAWQKAMQQTAQAQANAMVAAADAASQSDDPAGGAIATMLASAMMQQQSKPTNGAKPEAKKGAK